MKEKKKEDTNFGRIIMLVVIVLLLLLPLLLGELRVRIPWSRFISVTFVTIA